MSRAHTMSPGADAPAPLGLLRAIAVATLFAALLCAGRAAAQVQQQATQAAKQATQPGAAQQPAPLPAKPLPRIQASSSGVQTATFPDGIPATHTIVRGETLWGIAQRYLNDPYLWPEIYRLNTDVVEDPRWIYPGEVLRLPGAAPTTAQVGGMTVNTPDTVAPEEVAPQGATIFTELRTVSGTSRRANMLGAQSPTVRRGEYLSAPFAASKSGPAWTGKLVESSGTQGIEFHVGDRSIQLLELVTIVPPSGTAPQVGTQYLIVTHGPEIDGIGEAVIPTGIVRVESYDRGKSAVARVTSMFEEVLPGQWLIPIEHGSIDAVARPVPITNGPMSTVVYVHNKPAVPTIQAFIIVSTKGLGAVRPGDILNLVRPAETMKGAVPTPEEVIGTAQVVRVTPQGATAVLSTQKSGVIKEKTPVRLAARMPAS